jgi:bifunctional non-homologous end joining protein LigD
VSRRAAVESLPKFIEPMLAASARAPPLGDGWLLELKWDGCRAQLIVDRGVWTVRSRTGRCMTGLDELSVLIAALSARRVIIDGELVCLGADGKADFSRAAPAY